MKFIFGPTDKHIDKYCELNEIDKDEVVTLDLEHPWETLEELLSKREDTNDVLILDNDYRSEPVLFQQVMSYIEENDTNFRVEIVDNVCIR